MGATPWLGYSHSIYEEQGSVQSTQNNDINWYRSFLMTEITLTSLKRMGAEDDAFSSVPMSLQQAKLVQELPERMVFKTLEQERISRFHTTQLLLLSIYMYTRGTGMLTQGVARQSVLLLHKLRQKKNTHTHTHRKNERKESNEVDHWYVRPMYSNSHLCFSIFHFKLERLIAFTLEYFLLHNHTD